MKGPAVEPAVVVSDGGTDGSLFFEVSVGGQNAGSRACNTVHSLFLCKNSAFLPFIKPFRRLYTNLGMAIGKCVSL